MKTFLRVLFFSILTIIVNCSKQPLNPSSEELNIKIQIKEGQSENLKIGINQDLQSNNKLKLSNLKKIINNQQIDQAMIMVLDFTAFKSSDYYWNSEDYTTYTQTRNNWPGDLTKWGEWEKLLGDYFRIVTNQGLTIGENFIEVGTVSGVIGLNYVVIAFIEDGLIKYWGEGEVRTEEGKTAEADIYMILI